MSDTSFAPPGRGLICHSPRMRELLRDIERTSAVPGGVVLAGEPGTGRGLVARTIHAGAHDQGAPFVAVHCDKADHSNLEMELFGTIGPGHRSGPPPSPFSTIRPHPERVAPGSLLHRARGGTIYFAHVEMLSDRAQARLAHLFDDNEAFVSRAQDPEPFHVRPMTAMDTHPPPERDEDRIRPDFLKRLATFTLNVPPLRDRREDIPELTAFFVGRACRQRGLPAKTLVPEVQAVLAALPWKGNARELNELIDALVLKSDGGEVTLHALVAHLRIETPGTSGSELAKLGTPGAATLREARMQFEREYISTVLAHHRGRIPDAARALGIQRTNLYRKMRTLQVIQRRVPTPGNAS